ncbi:MAG: glycosyltransferase [Bryobacteraceae bacterium]|nr:glycosyltransferase [Bryobacteraceae bacterium]
MILVNWNRRELLRAALESLSTQENVVFEAIVVDNGSQDGSLEMISAFEGGYPLRLIRNAENRGFCAANNQGIAVAQGHLIALLNNDAVAEPGWLYQLEKACEERTEIGMVASKILVYEDPQRLDKVGHLIYPDGQNRGRGSGEVDRGQYDGLADCLWPDGCAAMYRKAMLDEVGGFDEDFFAYADDADLGMRGRLAGWDCVFAPLARVRHHRGATLGLGSARRLVLIERNRVLLAAKLFPWRLLLLNPFYYLLRLSAGALAGVRGEGETNRYPGWRGKARIIGALLRGDLEALALLPRILAKRKEIRRFRKRSDAEVLHLLRQHRISLKEISTQAV